MLKNLKAKKDGKVDTKKDTKKDVLLVLSRNRSRRRPSP